MKDQFQSTETLRLRFLPFVNKLTGEYIIGSDTCTLTIKKPDNTTTSVGATFDSDVSMWYYDVSTGSYQQGEWRIKAVSNDTNALPQWKVYIWGDYVEDITTVKTRLGVPVAASISADIANVQTTTNTVNTTTNTINTKIGTPVSSVSADIAGVQTTANTINTKLGTPVLTDFSTDLSYLTSLVDPILAQTYTAALSADANAASALAQATAAASTSSTINTKIGTPVVTVSSDIAGVQTTANTINTNVNAVNTKLGTPVAASVSADIANVQTSATTAATQSTTAATQATTAATQATTAATQATTAATQSTSAASYSLICRKVLTNRWKVDSGLNKFFIYDDDETTVIAEFDLLDSGGSPTNTTIYERDPV